MQEFEKQTEIMDMKEEMMNEAIDDAMGDEDDEAEGYVLKNFFMCLISIDSAFLYSFSLDICF